MDLRESVQGADNFGKALAICNLLLQENQKEQERLLAEKKRLEEKLIKLNKGNVNDLY